MQENKTLDKVVAEIISNMTRIPDSAEHKGCILVSIRLLKSNGWL